MGFLLSQSHTSLLLVLFKSLQRRPDKFRNTCLGQPGREEARPVLPFGELTVPCHSSLGLLLCMLFSYQSVVSMRPGTLPQLPLGPPSDISQGLRRCLLSDREACCLSVFRPCPFPSGRFGGHAFFHLLLLCLLLVTIAYF